MRRSILLCSTAALALGAAAMPAWSQDEGRTEWRVFVADHADGTVTAMDLASDEVIGAFELDSAATLYATSSNRAVYAVQGAANTVSVIRSGLEIEDHGDHGDISVGAPELEAVALQGERPVHFVEHDGQIAIFYDGEGIGRVFSEDAFLDAPATIAMREVPSSAPHHGVTIPWGEHAIATDPTPDAETTLPRGVLVIGPDGAQIGDLHACPDLHGEATSGNITAIACSAGILLVSGSGAPEVTLLPYAESLGEGSTTTLLGGVGEQYFLGNWGPDKVVLIDPRGEEPFRRVDLPTRRVHFAVDPQRPGAAYIFTEDGDLHRLDVAKAEIVDTLELTPAYSMDGEWNLPRPRLAVAGGDIVVTDPLNGLLHVVDAETFSKEREIAVEGVPFNLVAVGASGAEHRELGAHVHGTGSLNIAIEGNQLAIELEAPGMDIVGFEHEASTEADQAAIARAIAQLEDPLAVFGLPADAGCTVDAASASLVGEHEDEEHAEAEHEHEHEEGGEHTEFAAAYALTCANAPALAHIELTYFDLFENAQALEVQVLTAAGANAYEVTRAEPRLNLAGTL